MGNLERSCELVRTSNGLTYPVRKQTSEVIYVGREQFSMEDIRQLVRPLYQVRALTNAKELFTDFYLEYQGSANAAVAWSQAVLGLADVHFKSKGVAIEPEVYKFFEGAIGVVAYFLQNPDKKDIDDDSQFVVDMQESFDFNADTRQVLAICPAKDLVKRMALTAKELFKRIEAKQV